MSNLTRSLIVIIAIVLIVAGVFYYGNFNINGRQSSEVVKLGAILPLTGNEASVGVAIKNGLELAVKKMNGSGGSKFEIIYEDSHSDPETAISAYKKLTQIDGVKEIFTSISGVTLAVAPLAEADKVIIVSVTTASSKISQAGDYIFRHNLLPQDETRALASKIYSSGVKELPLIVVNGEAVTYRDDFRKEYESLGGKISLVEMYTKGSRDYRTELLKIKELKPQAVLSVGYATETGLILKQAKELGLDAQWYSLYTAEDPKVLDIAGKSAEGLIYSHFYNASSTASDFLKFRDAYQSAYGVAPVPASALAYDSINILFTTLKKCDRVDTDCVKMALYKTQNYSGITGKITFDQNGDTKKAIVLKTIKNGQFVVLEQ